MKKIILILLIVFPTAFAQSPRNRPDLPTQIRFPFFVEIHVIPDDSANSIYYDYRIPYNQLTFIKDGAQYKAALNVSIEVFDTTGQFISRQMKQRNILVNNFTETNSADAFCEGSLMFQLPNDDYKFILLVNDAQSGQEAKLEPVIVKKLKSDSTQFLDPIVLDEGKIVIEGNEYFELANYEGKVPFSSKKYELAFPCRDTTIEKIYVKIINNRDTVFTDYLTDSFLSAISIKEKNHKIILDSNEDNNVFRNFILNDFSNSLSEGRIKIIVSNDKNESNPYIFTKEVTWFNKPFSLRNPEFAITSLKYMGKDSVVNKLLDADKLDYMPELKKYWKKYDPTPATEFNELMNEYYSRIDYAVRNFASLSNRDGANTDRGKIFIRFGMPTKIERSSDDDGKVVELWIYNKEKLSFRFVDKKGTGEFPLVKG